MFGMGWGEIIIILVVGIFVLGPERIPVAVRWVSETLTKVRSMAAGAQEELRKEIGPELDELRRQVADLQSLKEIQELRSLRDLDPRKMIGKNLLGEEFSGGVTGFLGLDKKSGPPAEETAEQLSVGERANAAAAVSSGAGAVAGRGTLLDMDKPVRRVSRPLAEGERPPFDPEGT
ncbi:twin-arginine translocase subunit TatB [Nakamurella silvestris]|nr:twin-arginine translocase subunit TatB [Nakamurella silvestris]